MTSRANELNLLTIHCGSNLSFHRRLFLKESDCLSSSWACLFTGWESAGRESPRRFSGLWFLSLTAFKSFWFAYPKRKTRMSNILRLRRVSLPRKRFIFNWTFGLRQSVCVMRKGSTAFQRMLLPRRVTLFRSSIVVAYSFELLTWTLKHVYWAVLHM